MTKLDPSDKNIVILTMKEFIESQKCPYTAIDVKSHLKSKLDVDLPVQLIRKWLTHFAFCTPHLYFDASSDCCFPYLFYLYL